MNQQPKTDPVIEEIHKVRREISHRFGGDVRAIAADANARMVERVVSSGSRRKTRR
jgi:hypothetical protein